ncbi:DUF2232 domain-containing protein [Methylobacterium nodulans]|uniref:DUF2232 domain-containing protein n=1 Tax=Methylobacterium nodulans (strain LMG 21967 / CNCM I-2342 / ORS 2060) TaxID=460265 RepID=B8IED0_METNO|nr:DUF2232 domain-containing protein [Methylobacterium nodulans]ACL59502.1 conserved hypothetical protein [Methylobacterium nodulans ORS 2060]
MASSLGIGVVAGLASALLIGVIVTATPLALLLYLLAPLPIVIVALGWSHRAGLVAAATGTVALMLAASPLRGLAFLVSTALPAWWLGYLALLGRPAAGGPPSTLEWYPLGRLLAWTAATAAVAIILVVMLSSGDHAAYEERIRRIAHAVMQIEMQTVQPGGAPPLPEADLARVADRLARIAPAVMGVTFTLLLVFYLWAAGRIVHLSGRLPRPWPDIPGTMMPRRILWGLAAAVALTFAPGFAGTFGIGLVGALCAAFALQGLAAIHDRSRGRPGRAPLLIGLYLLVLLTQGLALAALTLFGLADTLFSLRRPAEVPTP